MTSDAMTPGQSFLGVEWLRVWCPGKAGMLTSKSDILSVSQKCGVADVILGYPDVTTWSA